MFLRLRKNKKKGMPYKCSLCDYTADYKKDILKHFNKKKKCSDKKEEPEIVEIISDITCNRCNKNFANNSCLSRHLKICKHNQVSVNNTTTNTTNITNNNNITNNQTINYITISLTPYNDPNMEGMRPYLEAALRKTFLSVPNLIESVHFNNDYPENQNICITNKRTKDAKVFDGKKWKTINKELLLNEIVDTYERELTNYAEENGKTRFIKEYNDAKKRGGANVEKDLKEEVHNILYDNSEMVNTKIKEVQKPKKPENNEEED